LSKRRGYVTNSFDKLDLVRIVDRMGFTTSFGYDAIRRKIAETNALGTVTRYGYCDCGAVSSITNAYGVSGIEAVTIFTFDLQER